MHSEWWLAAPKDLNYRASGDSDRSGGGTCLCRVDLSMSSVRRSRVRFSSPVASRGPCLVRSSRSQCDAVVMARLIGFRLHESTQGTADDAEIDCSTDVLPRS
jgi:hypothetical protein